MELPHFSHCEVGIKNYMILFAEFSSQMKTLNQGGTAVKILTTEDVSTTLVALC